MKHRNLIRLAGLLLLFSVVVSAFHGSQTRIESAIDEAFKQAIEQDYQHRKSYLTRNMSDRLSFSTRDYALAPTFDRKISNYTIRTHTGITTYQFKDSVNEEVAKRLLNQHLLKDAHPLHPNQLKSYFQKQLKEKEIEGECGILYIRDNMYLWSEADSMVPRQAYSTPRRTLDIAGNQKVQAWSDYGWSTLFHHLDPVAFVFLLLIIIILMRVWVNTRKQEESASAEEAETNVRGIVIDMEKQELTIDGIPCAIAKFDLTLLQMLHERDGNCLTREEIKLQFWPTDENADEKIDTHIKTIRKTLKEFPEYQVITVRGKGYYLQATK